MPHINVEVVKRFTLDGTIDGHDPVGVTFRITGGKKPFRLTVITVNWGRGYSIEQFHRNVLRVLEVTDEREYVIILMQEIDEADKAPEHPYIKAQMEKGTTFVQWVTREPLAVSPGIPVRRERKVMTMDQGSNIGANPGTGPRRFLTSCISKIEGVDIWTGNQHPHRVDPKSSKKNQQIVQKARRRGEEVTHDEVMDGLKLADLAIWGGDMNDGNYPKLVPGEKVANSRGLDTIRYALPLKG